MDTYNNRVKKHRGSSRPGPPIFYDRSHIYNWAIRACLVDQLEDWKKVSRQFVNKTY